jgi:subtilisin family serine protease
MRNVSLFLLFSIGLIEQANSQEKLSYSTKTGSFEFTISPENYYVTFEKGEKEFIQQKARQFTLLSETFGFVTTSIDTRDFADRRITIAREFGNLLDRIEPVLIFSDGTQQVCKGRIIVKLKTNVPIHELLDNRIYTWMPDKFVENQYLITLENATTQDVFSAVDDLNRNLNVEFAEPNFTRFFNAFTNDPYYSSQWAINNLGYQGGTIDADMDVDDAWAYTKGHGIKVAIIDQGIDLSHPDLAANILPGYDATDRNLGGASENSDAHGTACAGIVAAVEDNGIGVRGIAPYAKILPVRVAYHNGSTWETDDIWYADGINWAVTSGADILSCSWRILGSPPQVITNAINNAVTNGRNINGVKKGCTVLFATGNDNFQTISYPASLNNVISVGASSMCDERKRKNPTSCDGENDWGSNYGTGLDVVAPGVQIYTTDISGSAGHTSGDYISDFKGTSAACPNAAGVVALILSANPNLTQLQARQILESNTDKLSGYTFTNVSGQPNGTWNSEVGHGRVNACKTAWAALQTVPLSITGPSVLCTTNRIFTLQNAPVGANVNWSVSPASLFAVDTGSGASFTTRAANASSSGSGFITAQIFGECGNVSKTYNVWVGKSQVSGILSTGGPLVEGSVMSVCNLTTVRALMTITGSAGVAWTKFYSNPGNITWSQEGNNLKFNFYMVGQTAEFRLTVSNDCGSILKEYQFKSIDCSSNCNQYQVSPNPASKSIDIVVPNIISPCATTTLTSEDFAQPEIQNELSIQSVILVDLQGQALQAQDFFRECEEGKFGYF